MKRVALFFLFALLLAGCNGIWNGADLENWVHKQAVKAGCEPDSIALADWYVPQNGENVWRGECVDQETGEVMELAIGVDKVWRPSEGESP